MSFPRKRLCSVPPHSLSPRADEGLPVLSQTAACGEQSRPPSVLPRVQGPSLRGPWATVRTAQLSLVTVLEILATRSEQEISLTRAFTCLQTTL